MTVPACPGNLRTGSVDQLCRRNIFFTANVAAALRRFPVTSRLWGSPDGGVRRSRGPDEFDAEGVSISAAPQPDFEAEQEHQGCAIPDIQRRRLVGEALVHDLPSLFVLQEVSENPSGRLRTAALAVSLCWAVRARNQRVR